MMTEEQTQALCKWLDLMMEGKDGFGSVNSLAFRRTGQNFHIMKIEALFGDLYIASPPPWEATLGDGPSKAVDDQ